MVKQKETYSTGLFNTMRLSQIGQNFIKASDHLHRLPLGLGKADHSSLGDFDNEIGLCIRLEVCQSRLQNEPLDRNRVDI